MPALRLPSARVKAVVIAVGVAAMLGLVGSLVGQAQATRRVADHALRLHWTNAALGGAALTRAGLVQALHFGEDAIGGDGGDREEAASTLSQAQGLAAQLDEFSRGAPSGVDPATASLVGAYAAGVGEALEMLAAGHLDRAIRFDEEQLEPGYVELRRTLAAEQDKVLAAIDDSERRNGLLTGILRLFVMLVAPAVAILSYRAITSRRMAERRIRWEAMLQGERELREQRDLLVAGLSHELRTPLTSIVGFSRLLVEGVHPGATVEEVAGVINAESEELRRMIEDFLAAARIDTETLSVRPAPTDLELVLDAAAEPARRAGKTVSVSALGLSAEADAARLEHILRNLVSNAVKHGGPALVLSARIAHGEVAVVVSDNGVGVPRELEAKLFEPYAIDEVAVVVRGSVGLGLAVARALARSMGGDLTYVRELGWTHFILTLPDDRSMPLALAAVKEVA